MYLGVDIGGTRIKAVVTSESGELLARAQAPTPQTGPADAARAVALIARELDPSGACSMGATCPGDVDAASGIVNCDNLNWSNVDMLSLLREHTGREVLLCNDGHAALKAELRSGAFAGQSDCVYVAIGTGIGGDVIIGGNVLREARPLSCEIGHMITHAGGRPCMCGNRGCFEKYASASALNAMAAKLNIDAQTLIERAKTGDAVCKRAWKRYIRELSAGIMSLMILYAPDIVCVGGGVSEAGAFLTDSILSALKSYGYFTGYFKHVHIVTAKYGNDAGAYGAAVIAMERALCKR